MMMSFRCAFTSASPFTRQESSQFFFEPLVWLPICEHLRQLAVWSKEHATSDVYRYQLLRESHCMCIENLDVGV